MEADFTYEEVVHTFAGGEIRLALQGLVLTKRMNPPQLFYEGSLAEELGLGTDDIHYPYSELIHYKMVGRVKEGPARTGPGKKPHYRKRIPSPLWSIVSAEVRAIEALYPEE